MSDYIEVEGEDLGRPASRPPKTSWKIEWIKKSLRLLQHLSSYQTAKIVWHYFSLPGTVKFSDHQKTFLAEAQKGTHIYQGFQIMSYRWGQSNQKVLLCHGWRSKSADFEQMIRRLTQAGYQVDAIDMKAHGQSEGKHTALPEFRDIIKHHIQENGRYHSIIGHSMGALAVGVALRELNPALHPRHFLAIGSPPYISYFIQDIIHEVKLKKAVFEKVAGLIEQMYHQPIDYFDLRSCPLPGVHKHLIYCEDDSIISFAKGTELHEAWGESTFAHVKGLGHYKIIHHERIIEHIIRVLSPDYQ